MRSSSKHVCFPHNLSSMLLRLLLNIFLEYQMIINFMTQFLFLSEKKIQNLVFIWSYVKLCLVSTKYIKWFTLIFQQFWLQIVSLILARIDRKCLRIIITKTKEQIYEFIERIFFLSLSLFQYFWATWKGRLEPFISKVFGQSSIYISYN